MTRVWPYHYNNYDSKERFCSYWHQINEVISVTPEKVLEVGIGNGFVSNYIKNRGIKVITLDIDKRLNPDIVGSVLELALPNESFDVVTCCEVLEHLAYKDFRKALSEMFRVSKSRAIVSLPDISRVYRVHVYIPKIGEIKKLISLPWIKKPTHNFNQEYYLDRGEYGYSIPHYWEIGEVGYSLSKISNDIKSIGFKIAKTYRVFEKPYHRFFVLAKDAAMQKSI